jgi:hypothetical protein
MRAVEAVLWEREAEPFDMPIYGDIARDLLEAIQGASTPSAA